MKGTASYQARLTAAVAAIPWQRLATRATVLVAALAGIESVRLTGGQPNGLVALLVAGLAILAGARPDSYGGGLVVGVVVVHWYFAAGPTALTWAVIPALCLLVGHAGLAALAVTPPACFLPRRSVRRGALHVGAVAVTTVVVAAVSRYLGGVAATGPEVVTVLGFGALAATAFVVGQRALVRDP